MHGLLLRLGQEGNLFTLPVGSAIEGLFILYFSTLSSDSDAGAC